MDIPEIIERLNAHKPGFLNLLGGEIVGFDPEQHTCTFEFTVPLDYCHSGDIVQGGFVTAMLDACMAHAIFGVDQRITRLSSLEISTRFLNATRGNQKLTVVGKIDKATQHIAFMTGSITDESGVVTATAQSVAKLSRS